MRAFLARRLLLSLGVLLAVSYGTFILIATQFSATCTSRYTPSEVYPPLADNVVHASTLWLDWLRGIPNGRSFGNVCGAPVAQNLWLAFGHTMALLALTLVLVLALGLVLGVAAAARAGGWFDLGFRAFAYTAWAIPPFLLALVFQSGLASLSSHGVHLFPKSGWPGGCPYGLTGCFGLPPASHGLAHAAEVLRALVVPALALAVAFVGLHSRYLRSALLVALGSQYTTTARAKGLPERLVVLRHALRNSLGVFTSVLFLDFGAVIGASLAVDWVFGLNGLGLLFLGEIGALGDLSGNGPKFLDPYAIMALLTVTAVLVAVASLLADLVVVALDPRVRAE